LPGYVQSFAIGKYFHIGLYWKLNSNKVYFRLTISRPLPLRGQANKNKKVPSMNDDPSLLYAGNMATPPYFAYPSSLYLPDFQCPLARLQRSNAKT
jgi:hypothetical protein